MMLGMPEVRPGYAPGSDRAALPAVQGIELHQDGRSMLLPVDRHLATLVPFRGLGGPNGGSFRYIAAADILEGRLPPASLEAGSCWSAPPHRVCRICALRRSGAYPGVEAHANMISGFLDGRNRCSRTTHRGLTYCRSSARAFCLPWCCRCWVREPQWSLSLGLLGDLRG